MEALTKHISKLSQELQVVLLIKAKFNPSSVIFVEVIIQMVIVPFKIIHMKNRSITWAIKEDKVSSSITIIILKVGKEIKIKVFGGIKMLVHLASNRPFSTTTTIISFSLGENKQI